MIVNWRATDSVLTLIMSKSNMKMILNKEELQNYLVSLHEKSMAIPSSTTEEMSRRLGWLDVLEKLHTFTEDYL